jgi:hypothetical protein
MHAMEMRRLLLAAEAEDEGDELLGTQRKSGWMLGALSAIIILVSLGIIAWVVTRPRPGAPASGASTEDIAPEPAPPGPGGEGPIEGEATPADSTDDGTSAAAAEGAEADAPDEPAQ